MRNRFLLALCCFLGGIQLIQATHIVGGEITYRCLGNTMYEVTLTVYRDCYNGQPPFDDPAAIGVFNSDWGLVDTLFIPQTTDDTLPIILSNPCLVAPPDVCVHRTVYRDTVLLPFLEGGYTLVYQRCCRNKLIRNLPDPESAGASYIATMTEQTLQECNNAAVFNNWPPVAICIHQPIDFDHAATDPDGDSLVYRICTPLDGATYDIPMPQPPFPGPYQEVLLLDPPYSLGNLLGGDPLTIDSQTGFMTGVPNTIGNFVVGVCVDEYRGGNIISTTRRDFQYNVSNCGQPVAAFFSPDVLCDTLTVAFDNNSTGASAFQWFFDWGNNNNLTSTANNPVFQYPDTGFYEIALVAKPGDPCSDTTYQTVHLTNSFAAADLTLEYPDCDGGALLLQAFDQSVSPVNPITGYAWNLTGPLSAPLQSQQQNPSFLISEPGLYELALTITTANGCTETVTLPISPPFLPTYLLTDSLIICAGDTIPLFPAANPEFDYVWAPASSLSSATAPNPLASPPVSTLYTVTISGNGPCTGTGQIAVQVLDPEDFTAVADPDTIYLGDTSQLLALLPGTTDFVWQPSESLSNQFIANPVASPSHTTTYTVTIPFAGGCTASRTVTVVVLIPFCEEPYVFFPTGFSPNLDGENDALKLESTVATSVYWVIYNRWGEKVFEADSLDDAWDGTYRGKDQPAETYGYYLRVGCLNGEELVKKGNVTLLR